MFYGGSESYERVRNLLVSPSIPLQACTHAVPASSEVVLLTLQAVNQALHLQWWRVLQGLKGEMDMADALLRNVYGNDVTQRPHAVALAAYVKR